MHEHVYTYGICYGAMVRCLRIHVHVQHARRGVRGQYTARGKTNADSTRAVYATKRNEIQRKQSGAVASS